MIQSRTLLLTGGAGFIGTSLTRRLLEHNQVVVLDNGARNALDKSELVGHLSLRIVTADVLDAAAVREAMRGCQMVIHLAAIASRNGGRAVGVLVIRLHDLGLLRPRVLNAASFRATHRKDAGGTSLARGAPSRMIAGVVV